MLDFLAVIPARGGSKGIPRKNIRPIAGKPLIAWSIEAARESKLLDDFVVSTEDDEIAAVSRAWGAKVLPRPRALASDTATTVAVLQHVLEEMPARNIVLLQPTSPLREPGLIDRCIRRFRRSGAENLGTGFTCKFMEYGSYTSRRQELNGFFYDNGNVYVVGSRLIKRGKMYGRKVERVEISREQGLEIDDELDFFLNEQLLLRQNERGASLSIDGRRIGGGRPLYVIAEAGVNHNGSLAMAKRLVDAAKAAGADAVKFQTFNAEALAAASAPKARYQQRSSGSGSQLEMLRRLELSAGQFQELAAHCRRRGITFLSTPFDLGSAKLLKRLGVPAFKISSGELTNAPLLSEVASYGKPVILSTGMATLREVETAVVRLRQGGCRNLALLHCTSSYPAAPSDLNLRAMGTLRARFGVATGYSDHSLGSAIPLAVTAMGASILEKHLTLDTSLPGPDHRASMPPREFAEMVRSLRDLEKALGDGTKAPASCEREIKAVARKSVVAARSLPAGSVLTSDMLAVKRPGTGIDPGELESLIGRKLRRPLEQDGLLSWAALAPS